MLTTDSPDGPPGRGPLLGPRDGRFVAEALLVYMRLVQQSDEMAGLGHANRWCDPADIGAYCIDLAKLLGVKDEFLQLIFSLPVLNIKCKEMDPEVKKYRPAKHKLKLGILPPRSQM